MVDVSSDFVVVVETPSDVAVVLVGEVVSAVDLLSVVEAVVLSVDVMKEDTVVDSDADTDVVETGAVEAVEASVEEAEAGVEPAVVVDEPPPHAFGFANSRHVPPTSTRLLKLSLLSPFMMST